jgi:hypothetical protein
MIRDYNKATAALLSGFSAGDRVDERFELKRVLYFLGTLLALLSLVILIPDYPIGNLTITELMFTIFFLGGILSLFAAIIVAYGDYRDFDKVKSIFEEAAAKKFNLSKDEILAKSDDNEIKEKFKFKVGTLLGEYYSPLINQIMSIGVVPIILGIIVLILADLTSIEPYFFYINITTALLLIGGCMEAMAFLIGFFFPEGAGKDNILNGSDHENINEGDVNEEVVKRIMINIMPELQKGINETFKNMTIETRVSYNDINKTTSSPTTKVK